MLTAAVRAYDKLALAKPILAKSIVSFTTYATAECVRQGVIGGSNDDDGSSSSSCVALGAPSSSSSPSDTVSIGFRQGLVGIAFMACVGAAIHAPWINFWFGLLERLRPGKSSLDILSKVLLDQLIGSPLYYILIMTVTGLADGHSWRSSHQRIRRSIFGAMRLSWTAWPLLHIVNFSLVPLPRRALLLQLGGLLWAIFLCYSTANQQIQGTTATIEDDT